MHSTACLCAACALCAAVQLPLALTPSDHTLHSPPSYHPLQVLFALLWFVGVSLRVTALEYTCFLGMHLLGAAGAVVTVQVHAHVQAHVLVRMHPLICMRVWHVAREHIISCTCSHVHAARACPQVHFVVGLEAMADADAGRAAAAGSRSMQPMRGMRAHARSTRLVPLRPFAPRSPPSAPGHADGAAGASTAGAGTASRWQQSRTHSSTGRMRIAC